MAAAGDEEDASTITPAAGKEKIAIEKAARTEDSGAAGSGPILPPGRLSNKGGDEPPDPNEEKEGDLA